MGKFFYEHLRDDVEFAETIHALLCECKDGSCGRVMQWANPDKIPEPTLSDFQESA